MTGRGKGGQSVFSNSTRILLVSVLLTTASVLLLISQSRKYRTISSSTTTFNNSAYVKKMGVDYWLAIKAMGIGTLLAMSGVGIVMGGVSKMMGVEKFSEFGERMTMLMGGSRHDIHESEQELQQFFRNNKQV